jgi:hypothetical protein
VGKEYIQSFGRKTYKKETTHWGDIDVDGRIILQ